MYDSSRLEELALSARGDAVRYHCGGYRRLIQDHQRQIEKLVASGGLEGLRELGRHLRYRIADARTLYQAACELRPGHKAPGPSGLRLEELHSSELWSLSRALAKAIRSSCYRPGPERTVQIPKPGKPDEYRQLSLQSAEDRVVGRALVLILQPMLERLFSPLSFGFRPHRGRLEALATALAWGRLEKQWVWVADDVAKAFDHIPFERLMDVCGKWLPEDMLQFIRLVSYTGKPRGLRQGAPASPLLVNWYFDHFLDQPWQRHHPDLPLLRYADDLLLCPSEKQAADAHAQLSQLAIAAGTPLKTAASSAIANLQMGQPLRWLGYQIQREGRRLAIRIGHRCWDQLQLRLAKAHARTHAQLRSRQIVRGWLEQMGPCFAFEDRTAVLDRIRQVAGELAFAEIPSSRKLMAVWEAAHRRWLQLQMRRTDWVAKHLTTMPSAGE